MVAAKDSPDANVVREAAGVSAGAVTSSERDGGLFRLFLSYLPDFTGIGAIERTTYEILIRSKS